jgi:predicted PurR-regulated permease PerM
MIPPDRLSDRTYLRRVLTATAVVVATVVILAVLWRARLALLVIYLSVLVAAGLASPVSVLERWRPFGRGFAPRWLAALVIYVLTAIGVGVLLVLVLNPLVAQAEQLWTGLPQQFDHLQDVLRHYGLVGRRVTLQEAVQNVPKTDALGSMNTVLTAGFTFAGVMAAIVSVVILSYYVVVQGEGVALYFLRWIPEARQAAVQNAVAESIVRIGRWLEGTILIAAIMGAVVSAALWLLGVPYFYVVGLVAALGEAVPMVGPIVAGLVATAVALTVSPQLGLVVCFLFVVIHELEANVLVPKIMEGRVGIGAIAVMSGLLIGWELTGVVGAVVAIPTVAILTVVADQFGPHRRIVRRQADRPPLRAETG